MHQYGIQQQFWLDRHCQLLCSFLQASCWALTELHKMSFMNSTIVLQLLWLSVECCLLCFPSYSFSSFSFLLIVCVNDTLVGSFFHSTILCTPPLSCAFYCHFIFDLLSNVYAKVSCVWEYFVKLKPHCSHLNFYLYHGNDSFWVLLADLLRKLEKRMKLWELL